MRKMLGQKQANFLSFRKFISNSLLLVNQVDMNLIYGHTSRAIENGDSRKRMILIYVNIQAKLFSLYDEWICI